MSSPLERIISSGSVRGIESEGTLQWRGVPIAEAPVGPLRYKAPVPISAWQGTKDCTRWGAAPPQMRVSAWVNAGPFSPVSEDCLHINVTVPKGTHPDAKLPVLVWIYGGGFSVGSNLATYYNGANVAKAGNIVYVQLSYRLNAFGCMSFTRYNSDKHTFEPNVFLKDQLLGLHWVQNNIAQFGGHPRNVTLFGESAGAASIICLSCVKGTEPLYQRAYCLSPSLHMVSHQHQHDHYVQLLVHKLLGRDVAAKASNEEVAEALLTRPWHAISLAAHEVFQNIQPDENPGGLACGPVIEPGFLDASPIDLYRAGKQHKKPLVLSNCDREGAFFTVALPVIPISEKRVEKMFALTQAPDVQQAVYSAYGVRGDKGKSPRQAFIDLGGDSAFWHATLLLAEAHAKSGCPTWYTMQLWAPPLLRLLGFDSTHLLGDVGFYLRTANRDMWRLFTLGGWWAGREAQQMTEQLSGYLFHFIQNDKPASQQEWPTYDAQRRATLVTEAPDKISVVDDFRKEKRLAWADWRCYTNIAPALKD